MTGKRRQKALGESQQQFAYRMNAAVRTVASDFSRFGVRSGLQNGRADSGRFGNGEMSLSIALVPVKTDQVPDLHAALEGGSYRSSLQVVSA